MCFVGIAWIHSSSWYCLAQENLVFSPSQCVKQFWGVNPIPSPKYMRVFVCGLYLTNSVMFVLSFWGWKNYNCYMNHKFLEFLGSAFLELINCIWCIDLDSWVTSPSINEKYMLWNPNLGSTSRVWYVYGISNKVTLVRLRKLSW